MAVVYHSCHWRRGCRQAFETCICLFNRESYLESIRHNKLWDSELVLRSDIAARLVAAPLALRPSSYSRASNSLLESAFRGIPSDTSPIA